MLEVGPKDACKYFGLIVHSELIFSEQLDKIVSKLGSHCDVVSKMRHFNLNLYYEPTVMLFTPAISLVCYYEPSFLNLTRK